MTLDFQQRDGGFTGFMRSSESLKRTWHPEYKSNDKTMSPWAIVDDRGGIVALRIEDKEMAQHICDLHNAGIAQDLPF